MCVFLRNFDCFTSFFHIFHSHETANGSVDVTCVIANRNARERTLTTNVSQVIDLRLEKSKSENK